MTKISAASLVSPLTGTEEIPIYDGTAVAKKTTVDDISDLHDARSLRGARIKNSVDQTIVSTSTWTELVFDGVTFDEGGFWSSGAANKLIVPEGEAGLYGFEVQVEWDPLSSSSKHYRVRIEINGSTFAEYHQEHTNSGSLRSYVRMQEATELSVGDELNVDVWQDVQANHVVRTAGTFFAAWMIARG